MMTYKPPISDMYTKSKSNLIIETDNSDSGSDKFVANVYNSDVWHARMEHIPATF